MTVRLMAQEIGKAALYNPANSDIYTVPMAQFVATFHRVAVPSEFKHLFFIQGGAQAVENALKTAMDWSALLEVEDAFPPLSSADVFLASAVAGPHLFSGRYARTLPPASASVARASSTSRRPSTVRGLF